MYIECKLHGTPESPIVVTYLSTREVCPMCYAESKLRKAQRDLEQLKDEVAFAEDKSRE